MKVIPVQDRKGSTLFLNVAKIIYRGDPVWVCPLDKEIEAAIILQLARVFERKIHYKEIEFSWVGDFNPKMKKVFMSVGSVPVKHYITYRYLFDRNRQFKRYPIPVDK